jgi:hypothetical protein
MLAMALLDWVKASVTIDTAGMPRHSKMIPSATLAALQEPQSPMAVTTTSARSASSRACSSGIGRPK